MIWRVDEILYYSPLNLIVPVCTRQGACRIWQILCQNQLSKVQNGAFATPFASKDAMNTIIGDILADNPWGCTSHESGGETNPAIMKGSEYYSGTVVYENNEGKQVGRISVKAPSSGGFDTNISTILANTALSIAMGGTASHDSSDDGYSVTLKCHAANGELFNVAFKRDRISVSSL